MICCVLFTFQLEWVIVLNGSSHLMSLQYSDRPSWVTICLCFKLHKSQFLPIKVCLIKVSKQFEPVLNILTLGSKYGDSKRLWGSSLINRYIVLNIPHFAQRSKPVRFIRSTFCWSNYHHLKAVLRLINSARYNRFQLLSLINKNVHCVNRP